MSTENGSRHGNNVILETAKRLPRGIMATPRTVSASGEYLWKGSHISPPPWEDNPSVAVLTLYPPEVIGGVSDIVNQEIEYFKRHGHKTLKITPRFSKDSEPWNEEDSMSLGYAIHGNHGRWGTDSWYARTDHTRRGGFEMEKALKVLSEYNWIECHGASMYEHGISLALARGLAQVIKPNPNMIFTETQHPMTSVENLKNYIALDEIKRFIPLTDVSFVNSIEMQELFQSVYKERFYIVPNPVDTKKFDPNGEKIKGFGDVNFDDEKVNMLYLGRIEDRKGVMTALEAVSIVRKDNPEIDLRFIIAGSGPDATITQQKAEELQIDDMTVFMGRVSEEDKPKLYRTADFCYFPAKYGESFGDVLLEAWASGKAVIAGPAFSPNLVRHTKEGYLLGTDSPYEGAYFVQKLASDADLRRNMGGAGREYSLRFDGEVVFGMRENIVEDVRKQKAERLMKNATPYFLGGINDIGDVLQEKALQLLSLR
ncbi:MAG TPA: glycosyltransferase [Patescibacteria group bacterium]|nr:glycosyltransferase [Patescibacteria group bacterium]